jgi:hypothetical protein
MLRHGVSLTAAALDGVFEHLAPLLRFRLLIRAYRRNLLRMLLILAEGEGQ